MAAHISYGAAPCALLLLLLSTAAAASHHRKIHPGDSPLPLAPGTGRFMLTGPGGETIRTGERLPSLAETEPPKKPNKLIAAWSPVSAMTLGIGFYRNPKMGAQQPAGSIGGPAGGKMKKVPAVGLSIRF
ncbi:MAG: hypothetical protein ACM3YM_04920 [Sphingomonadales bacterium]